MYLFRWYFSDFIPQISSSNIFISLTMSRVVDLLANLSNPDAQVRRSAEEVIYKARDDNIGTFLMELIYVVRDESMGPAPRQQALILLKNSVAFPARDDENKRMLEARWASVSAELKQTIRSELLTTLGSAVRPVRHIAALVVANLARIELPAKQWTDLVDSLYEACKTAKFEEAAITTLGYVCEESLASSGLEDYLQSYSAKILESVINGMQKQDAEICYQATNALCGSISFIHRNMEVNEQRDFILSSIFTNCVGKESRIIVKGLECLTRIAYEYYAIIGSYIDVMLDVTLRAIQSGDEQQALQGFTFWSTVCEVEVDLNDNGESAQNHKFAQATVKRVLPFCLNALTQQEDDRNDDDWDICAAGGVCLQAYAQALEGTILPEAVQFIMANINDPDWRKQDAAITAFGGILDGPTSADVGSILVQAFAGLLSFTDPSHHKVVRESSVWCISRVANFHADVIVEHFFDRTIQVAAQRMQEGGKISNRACHVIHNLCYELNERTANEVQQTNPFSKYFDALIQVLLQCIDNKNSDEHGVSMAAQETLSSLLMCAANDVLPKVHHLIPELLMRIKDNIELASKPHIDDVTRDSAMHMLAVLSGSLQNICSKLANELTPDEARMIANVIFTILSMPNGLMQDTLQVIGPLSSAMKGAFVPYLNDVARHLLEALKWVHEDALISIAISTVSDLCFAVELTEDFSDAIVAALFQLIQNEETALRSKFQAISSMGDIALCVSSRFLKYVPSVFPLIEHTASTLKDVDPKDIDGVELRDELVEAVCDAFTGFIQAHADNNQAIAPYVSRMTAFVGLFSTSAGLSDRARGLCIQVLGDIVNMFRFCQHYDAVLRDLNAFINDQRIGDIVRQAKQSNSESCRRAAQWAQEQTVLFLQNYVKIMGGHR